ncbi:MAG: hypothetical protein KIS96_06810 [Bauldia sp.]|nr:hypothetical protein [Bauldia sp.]
MAIELPNVNPKRQLARKLFDAIISEIPYIGGPYAAMLSVTHPSKVEQLQEKWQKDVTAVLNNLQSIVDGLVPTISISDDASAIGFWIAQNSELGRTDPVEFDTLVRQFPKATKAELEDACGELEHAGLASLTAVIGQRIRMVRPTIQLFEVFDPAVFEENNPRGDAAKLAEYILGKQGTVGAEEMMAHYGWNKRRFNPAIGIATSMIGDGRKSREVHPRIACRYVLPNPAERAALRQFAKEVLGTA